MAFRPGLDDDNELESLVKVWRDGQVDIDRRLATVHESIVSELRDPGLNDQRLRRLRLQTTRLEELRSVTDRVVDDLTGDTTRFIDEGGFTRIYGAGASRNAVPFSLTAPHRAAVNVLAQDTFDDVLEATAFVKDDAKRFVRDVGRQLTGFKLTSGTPVRAQARRFERDLRREFTQRGIGAVVYRDGSRHGFGEYAEMLLRTKTGVAYNQGTVNQARLLGIEFYELLDAFDCGLTTHRDPLRASGLIVDLRTAQSWPLGHPNCIRSINPRPDLNRDNVSDAVSVQGPEARADQVAFEQALRQQGEQRGRRRSRGGRAARPGRVGGGSRRVRREGREGRSVRPQRDTGQRVPAAPVPAPEPVAQPAPVSAEDQLAGLVAREAEAAERRNVSDSQGLTEIVTLPDGERFVSKQIANEGLTGEAPSLTIDREELATRVAEAVGARAPALRRESQDRFFLSFVDGRVGDLVPRGERPDVFNSDGGRSIGILDVLTGNPDRHNGNWIQAPDGVPTAIDHGHAFRRSGRGGDFRTAISEFADHFVLARQFKPNDMSPADMALIRGRIEALRPEFERAGHSDWHDVMIERVGELETNATGVRDRLEP